MQLSACSCFLRRAFRLSSVGSQESIGNRADWLPEDVVASAQAHIEGHVRNEPSMPRPMAAMFVGDIAAVARCR